MTTMIVALLLALIVPFGGGPDVAEINYFQFAECENVFYWQTDSEVNIWGFRLEHVAGGWRSDQLYAANYPSTHGMTYGIYGPQGVDLAGDYVLRVYFDNGTNRAEDIAERVCEWSPPWALRGRK